MQRRIRQQKLSTLFWEAETINSDHLEYDLNLIVEYKNKVLLLTFNQGLKKIC